MLNPGALAKPLQVVAPAVQNQVGASTSASSVSRQTRAHAAYIMPRRMLTNIQESMNIVHDVEHDPGKFPNGLEIMLDIERNDPGIAGKLRKALGLEEHHKQNIVETVQTRFSFGIGESEKGSIDDLAEMIDRIPDPFHRSDAKSTALLLQTYDQILDSPLFSGNKIESVITVNDERTVLVGFEGGISLSFSNRKALCGELRSEVLKEAMARGKFANLRDFIEKNGNSYTMFARSVVAADIVIALGGIRDQQVRESAFNAIKSQKITLNDKNLKTIGDVLEKLNIQFEDIHSMSSYESD